MIIFQVGTTRFPHTRFYYIIYLQANIYMQDHINNKYNTQLHTLYTHCNALARFCSYTDTCLRIYYCYMNRVFIDSLTPSPSRRSAKTCQKSSLDNARTKSSEPISHAPFVVDKARLYILQCLLCDWHEQCALVCMCVCV